MKVCKKESHRARELEYSTSQRRNQSRMSHLNNSTEAREKWETNTKSGEKSISLCITKPNPKYTKNSYAHTQVHTRTPKSNPINLFVSFWLPIRVVLRADVAHITDSKLMLDSVGFLYRMNFNFSMLPYAVCTVCTQHSTPFRYNCQYS